LIRIRAAKQSSSSFLDEDEGSMGVTRRKGSVRDIL